MPEYRLNMLSIQNGNPDHATKAEQAVTVQIVSYVELPQEDGPSRWVDSGNPMLVAVAETPECATITLPKPITDGMSEEERIAAEVYNEELEAQETKLEQSLTFALGDLPLPLFAAISAAVDAVKASRQP